MIKQTMALFFTAGMLMSTTLPADVVRRCDAQYMWQTTGGSIGPIPFGGFSAKGNCGSGAVADRCRKRARAAAVQCMKTQWEKRWRHHPRKPNGKPNGAFDAGPPEACLGAAKVENYSLSASCVTERKTGQHPNRDVICDRDAHSNNIKKRIRLATAGDIKSRLEAEVCCLYKQGAYQYPDNKNVHVRLIARTKSSSGNPMCSSSDVLSSDYKINCSKVRRRYCM